MKTLLLTVLLAAVGGCATHHEVRQVKAPPFYAPTTAVAQNQTNAYYLLPGSDGDAFIPRMEKFAYNTTNSTALIYTYDVQAISIRNSGGSGFRYRWTVEQP